MIETKGLRDEPMGALIARLVDRGRDMAKAEAAYYGGLASGKAKGLVVPAGLCIAAVMIVQAALTVLLIALGIALWRWLGPIGGMAASAVIGLVLAGVLVKVAQGRIKAMSGVTS